jgi:DNA-directed RNA polymerase subunit F
MPMNYRSHFQGSFDDYLDYLGEIVQAQVGWCKGKSHLYAGIDAHYIFKEEREPWEKALAVLKKGQGAEAQKEELENLMEKNIAYLRNFSAQRAKDLDEAFSSFLKGKIQKEGFAAEINKVLSDPPAGFFPEEKLVRTIEAVRKAQAEGIVIFAASLISGKKLWSGVEKAYSSPAKAPDKSLPLKDYLSIQAVRKTQK